MLTDYMIFGQSMLLAWRLQRSLGRINNISKRLWVWALVAIGFASLFGGTYHGLSLIIPEDLNDYLWKLTTISIGFVSCLIVLGTLFATTKGPWRYSLAALSLVQLLVYIAWMMTHDDFVYVIANYVPSMVFVFVLQAISLVKRNTGSEVFIMSGVFISFVGAGIQQSGFALHQLLNHNDIYHLIQMVGIYLFYRGALDLGDCVEEKSENNWLSAKSYRAAHKSK